MVEMFRASDVDAEGHRARRQANAVVAAGERIRTIGNPPDDLPERECDHEEAQSRRPQRKHAEQSGARSGQDQPRERGEQRMIARDSH